MGATVAIDGRSAQDDERKSTRVCRDQTNNNPGSAGGQWLILTWRGQVRDTYLAGISRRICESATTLATREVTTDVVGGAVALWWGEGRGAEHVSSTYWNS